MMESEPSAKYRVQFKERPDLSSFDLSDYTGRMFEGLTVNVQDEGEWRLIEIVPGDGGERDLLMFEPVELIP